MKYSFTLCVLLLPALAGGQVASHAPTLGQSGPAAASSPDKPVALVNGSVLTGSDLVREEYAIFPYARQHNGGIPKALAGEIHDGAMKMMVFEELVYQEALHRKLTVPAVKMQHAEGQFRKQFPTPEDYSAFLQSDFHGSQQMLDDKIRRSLLIESLLRTEVDERSAVSPAEVRAFYDKNAARFTHPEQYTFQTISVLPPPNATADQVKEGRRRIDQVFAKAKATKSAVEFGLLAEKTSDDDYRVVMGQHKPIGADQLAPPVLKALRTMHVGNVSDVIQLDQAYTIVRLNEHSPAGEAKFADVRADLAKEMARNKKNQLRMELDHKLRQNAKIEEF
ncbi:MAG TPA: peptidylprolyl isomerase [Acidobacteriaceae bacterium]|jgi:hypothetical protein|nr:peptidylprolyl isomerase [Acidobacteriaceae bacterium]